jgi:EAL domain-containing protein (putative c-di-GMP-specific phosphodiesterase class I)
MNLETDANAAVICAATINLAHSLKLKVVAEGVETEAQRHFLQTVHPCDLIQGYLFSRPLALADFESFTMRG